MGQFVDYRNDKDSKGGNKIKIEINKARPDDAILEKLITELIEKGWLDKVLKLSTFEKELRAIAILFTIGGIFYFPLLCVAIPFWTGALLRAIELELHMRKIRKFCEDNS